MENSKPPVSADARGAVLMAIAAGIASPDPRVVLCALCGLRGMRDLPEWQAEIVQVQDLDHEQYAAFMMDALSVEEVEHVWGTGATKGMVAGVNSLPMDIAAAAVLEMLQAPAPVREPMPEPGRN